MQERIEIRARLRARMLDTKRREEARARAGPAAAVREASYLLPDGSPWEVHELAWRFFEKADEGAIRYEDVPWPPGAGVLGGMCEQLGQRDLKGVRTAFRLLTLRWQVPPAAPRRPPPPPPPGRTPRSPRPRPRPPGPIPGFPGGAQGARAGRRRTATPAAAARRHPDKFIGKWGKRAADDRERGKMVTATNKITLAVRSQFEAAKTALAAGTRG